ncbi:MAG: SDR family oxidoreductase [Chitinophagaceae bacterium]|nr:MAG: SDR family oxidoreductase [Chitinophagaceae bacterium]
MKDQKYALLTGATSGIGLELARLFARDNYQLILASRNENQLSATAALLKSEGAVEVLTIPTDLFQPGSAKELYEKVLATGIRIDVLVNDAGQGVYGRFVDNAMEDEVKIIHLNIISLVTLTKLFVKDMVERGSGKVLNVASIAGKTPGPWQAVYHGTKAFVHSFNEAVNHELKDTGVTLTSLLPGATDTDFFRVAGMESSKVVQEGELADPADVAKDGYEALMAGKDMVVSGFKNKLNVAMGNVTPDSAQAAMMDKQQRPADN